MDKQNYNCRKFLEKLTKDKSNILKKNKLFANWRKDEFTTYVLLFCANANFQESTEEMEIIKNKITSNDYNHIHHESKQDNDYQVIQKIQSTLIRLDYSNEEKIKKLFLADGKYDILESNLERNLKHILNN